MKHFKLPLTLTAAIVGMLAAGSHLQASESDDRIESTFVTTYVYRTYLKDDAVKPVAKDGVLTLTGTVADESHKTLAQEMAASLPGVTRVDNQLATKADAATGSGDLWIERKLKFALIFHSNVSAKTGIAVKSGVVTLTGEAASSAARDLTGEYAKDIEGVKEVKNEMTVASASEPAVRTIGEKIDDASIAAQVKTALKTHRSTSSLSAGVVVRNGEVSLTGIAANAAEKTLVTKVVGDIHGVKSVKNQMTLAVTTTK